MPYRLTGALSTAGRYPWQPSKLEPPLQATATLDCHTERGSVEKLLTYTITPHLCTYQCQARGGGGGGRANHGNLTVAYIPRVGILIGHHAFDLSILYSRREVNHLFLLILTIRFRPGVGILIIFFRKCQNPHPMPDPPPPSGLIDTDRCIT